MLYTHRIDKKFQCPKSVSVNVNKNLHQINNEKICDIIKLVMHIIVIDSNSIHNFKICKKKITHTNIPRITNSDLTKEKKKINEHINLLPSLNLHNLDVVVVVYLFFQIPLVSISSLSQFPINCVSVNNTSNGKFKTAYEHSVLVSEVSRPQSINKITGFQL